MTALLPHVIRHAVTSKTVSAASQTFGLVTLTLVVVLLVEREALRVARARPSRAVGLTIVCVPLVIAVALTIIARVALVFQ